MPKLKIPAPKRQKHKKEKEEKEVEEPHHHNVKHDIKPLGAPANSNVGHNGHKNSNTGNANTTGGSKKNKK